VTSRDLNISDEELEQRLQQLSNLLPGEYLGRLKQEQHKQELQ
jgi:hypothetical protein